MTIVTDEADAVLDILSQLRAGVAPAPADWDRLFRSEGYRRLERRERAMQRPFADSAFRTFVLSDSLSAQELGLRRSLEAWRRIEIQPIATRVLAYLPEGTPLRARIYPVIKPRSNSFVFFEDSLPPAIFLFLDPSRTRAQLENTMAHELHHIGEQAACSAPPDAVTPPRVRTALLWMGAFGEGRAMLAAAGGTRVHPHAASPDSDRVRWDRDLQRADTDLKTLERFFLDILEGRLAGEDSVRAVGMSFFGVQGPWYTVGWLMSATIEEELGRSRLVASICEPRRFLRDYNAAARVHKAQPAPLPLWSDSLLDGLGASTEARGSHRVRHAVIGALIGGAAGVVTCTAISNWVKDPGTGFSTCTTKGYLLFGFGGAGLGAAVGGLIR